MAVEIAITPTQQTIPLRYSKYGPDDSPGPVGTVTSHQGRLGKLGQSGLRFLLWLGCYKEH